MSTRAAVDSAILDSKARNEDSVNRARGNIGVPKFIDGEDVDTIGEEPGFLIQTTKEGVNRWVLRNRPAKKNMSGEEVLSGWCGETDNVDCWARGLARVVRTTNNGRAQIVVVPARDVVSALEHLGYPELA